MREGLRVLEHRDEARETHLAELRADAAVGLRALRAGQSQPGEEVFDRLTGDLEDVRGQRR